MLAFTRSELEQRFVLLLAARRLPKPVLNHVLLGHEVDALWQARKLVAELDGWRAHGTYEAFAKDRRRDRKLTLAGYRVLRFTWREVVHQPDRVAGAIATGLGVRAW